MRAESGSDDAGCLADPYDGRRNGPPCQKGAIAGRLYAGWSATRTFDGARSSGSAADRVVEGRRAAIGLGTVCENDVSIVRSFQEPDDHPRCAQR
jgi:hypothetical protein